MTDDIAERTLAGLDRPRLARPPFAERLLERLDAELMAPPARSPFTTPLRMIGRIATLALVVVVALSIAGVIAAVRSGTGTASATPPAGVSPDVFPVGDRPGAIAFGEGGLWIADIPSGQITQLDPRSGATLEKIATGGSASYLAIGEGSVWVSDELANVVKRVDPRRQAVIATIPVTSGPYGIVVGGGSVWVTHLTGVVSRIDPVSNTVVATIPLSGNGLAQRATFAAGSVWVTEAADSAVYRIDPASNIALRIPAPPGSGPLGIAFGQGAIWVTNTDANGSSSVSRIDPATDQIVGSVAVGHGANGIVVDRGSVWVACQQDDTIFQIDATSLHLVGRPIAVGRGPAGLVVGERALWITLNGSGAVGRIALP